jgi:hypothetical protein
VDNVPESRRREIYAALGRAKAKGLEPDAARYAVAREFVLTVLKVEAVEEEGAGRGWLSG